MPEAPRAESESPEPKRGQTRREVLRKLRTAAIIGVGVGAGAGITGSVMLSRDPRLIILLKRIFGSEKEAPKKLWPYPRYEAFLGEIGPFPKDASFNERAVWALETGRKFLERMQGGITVVTEITGVDIRRNLYEELDLSSEKNVRAMGGWLGLVAHSSLAGQDDATELAQRMVYTHGSELFPAAEPHIMSIEAELMSHDGKAHGYAESLLRSAARKRLSSGIEVDSKNLNTPAPELSWVMLVAARLGISFHKKPIRLRSKQTGEERMIGPQELVSIARYYLQFIKEGHGGQLTEGGVHAVHGALVLLGTYGEELKKTDPSAADALGQEIVSAMHAILAELAYGAYPGADYITGGHLLQAVLDPAAGPVFSVPTSKDRLTAAQTIKDCHNLVAERIDGEGMRPDCLHADRGDLRETISSAARWELCNRQRPKQSRRLVSGYEEIETVNLQKAIELLKTMDQAALEKLVGADRKHGGFFMSHAKDPVERAIQKLLFTQSFIASTEARAAGEGVTSEESVSDIDVLAEIMRRAASDMTPLLRGENRTVSPISAVYMVAHAVAGLQVKN